MSKRFLILILFAFALRVSYIVFFHLNNFDTWILIDGDGYLEIARSFQEGDYLFSENHLTRMPLIPALIAFFTNIPLINSVYVIEFWNVLLDIVTLSCIFLFIRKYFDSKSAFGAGILYSLYPLAVYRSPLMNSEIIQGTILAFWIISAVYLLQNPSIRNSFILSIFTVLFLYINPAFQIVPLIFVFCLFLVFAVKRAVTISIVFLLPVIFFVLLWGVRNHVILGEFYLFDSRGGKEFWIGNNQETEGKWEGNLRYLWEAELGQYNKEASEFIDNRHDMNIFLYKKGVKEILSDPSTAVIIFVKKFFRFWFIPASERFIWATIPLQSIYLLLVGVGFYYGWKRNRVIIVPSLVILYFCAIYTLSYACIRFSHPIMPWVCAFGGIGLVALKERFGGVKL